MLPDYQPIDCNFYDRLEAAITLRETVLLKYLDEQGHPVEFSGRLTNTRVSAGEEFLQFGDQQEIRMDRILALNGIILSKTCHS